MMDEHIEFQFLWNYDNQLDTIQALEGLLRKQYNISFDTGGSPSFREWFVDESLEHPNRSRAEAIAVIRNVLKAQEIGSLSWSCKITFQEVSQ